MTHDELLARVDERQQAMDEKIDAILEQTKKTNGRLLIAEKEIDSLMLWKAELKGSFKTIIIVVTIIGSIAGWVISKI